MFFYRTVHSSFAILKRKRKLVALLLLFYRCIVTIKVLWLFLVVPWVCLQYMIVDFLIILAYFLMKMSLKSLALKGVQVVTMLPAVLLDFSLTVKAAPHECELRTSQPWALFYSKVTVSSCATTSVIIKSLKRQQNNCI